MSLFVYCPRKSQGALELVRALDARRLRKFDGMDFWDRNRRVELEPKDVVVCWGGSLPELEGIRVLNSFTEGKTKLNEIAMLVNAGVHTVTAYSHQKQIKTMERGYEIGLLPRSNHHVGGSDLLNGVQVPDFWVQKEKFKNEYRVHSFNGKSIRAGHKVLRDGFVLVENAKKWKPNANMAHPWIRSYDAGWRINYDEFQSTPQLRSLASQAVKALGLTFGAVDVGEREDGRLLVLEVNRAPGIEGNSINAYVKAIKKWIEKPQAEEAEAENPFAKRSLKRQQRGLRGNLRPAIRFNE